MMLPTPHRPLRGYVLLLTLVLLALAAATLTGVCLTSFRKTVAASLAQDALQRRWGMLSCQQTLLPRTEAILSQAEDLRHTRVSILHASITLGGLDMALIFSDEQAKVNVNTLYAALGPERAGQVLQTFMAAEGGAPPLRLSPAPVSPGPPATPAFGSFGQIFAHDDPTVLVSLSVPGVGATEKLTCWGAGQVHFQRVSRAVILCAAGDSVDPVAVDAILALRDQMPEISSANALRAVVEDPARRGALEKVLTDTSTCHGLWIVTSDKQRSWYSFWVQDDTAGGGPRTLCLTW